MFTTLVSVALFSTLAIRGARADFDIDTPVLSQCQPAVITWTSTNAEPYNLIVVPSDDVCGDELADLGDFNSTSATWTVNIPAGQNVTFSLQDALGDEAWSGSTTILPGNDTSCLNSTTTAASSGIQSSVVPATLGSAAVAPPATTLVVPADPTESGGVVNDAPPPASSSAAAVAVGAANTGDNPTSAGFSVHQLSGPIMVASALAALMLTL